MYRNIYIDLALLSTEPLLMIIILAPLDHVSVGEVGSGKEGGKVWMVTILANTLRSHTCTGCEP